MLCKAHGYWLEEHIYKYFLIDLFELQIKKPANCRLFFELD